MSQNSEREDDDYFVKLGQGFLEAAIVKPSLFKEVRLDEKGVAFVPRKDQVYSEVSISYKHMTYDQLIDLVKSWGQEYARQ